MFTLTKTRFKHPKQSNVTNNINKDMHYKLHSLRFQEKGEVQKCIWTKKKNSYERTKHRKITDSKPYGQIQSHQKQRERMNLVVVYKLPAYTTKMNHYYMYTNMKSTILK